MRVRTHTPLHSMRKVIFSGTQIFLNEWCYLILLFLSFIPKQFIYKNKTTFKSLKHNTQFQTSLTLHKWFCLLNLSFLCSGKLLLVLQTLTWVRINQDENGNCGGSEAGECVGILLSWWGQNLVLKGRLDWSLWGEILPQIWSLPSPQDKPKKPVLSIQQPTHHLHLHVF